MTAEFIIALVDQHASHASFHAALEENGADFSESLSSSLYRMINKLKPKVYTYSSL